jgi:hypothetical protein
MEVIGFLYVSLGSSTIQLHESLGSRRACACSEACLSIQNGDCVSECTIEEAVSVVCFFVGKRTQCKGYS